MYATGPTFIYIDYRLDTNEPFYVGKGTKFRIKRMKRNERWNRIYKKHGARREVVLGSRDPDFICEEEIRLIRELKTREYHGGANFTDGGEGTLGWQPSIETRQHMREAKLGRRFLPNHRENMSLAHKKRYESSEARKQTGIEQRRVWSDPQHRQRMSSKHSGENNSRAVLTEADVREIRHEWSQYDATPYGAIKEFCRFHAGKFHLTPENIYGIIKNKSWKHAV